MREPRVSSVMTTPVITARADTPFKELVATMAGKGISAIPVVDEAHRAVGVVSEADALAKQEFHGGADPVSWWTGRRRRTRWHKATGFTAADLMTVPVVTIGADDPVTVAARRLADKRLRRLFVVDDESRLVGVVARRDLLGMFLRGDEDIRADIEEQVLRRGMWLIPGTVTVSVRDGVVTLDGALEHRSAVEITGKLTHAVPGVVGVHNNVRYVIDDSATAGL